MLLYEITICRFNRMSPRKKIFISRSGNLKINNGLLRIAFIFFPTARSLQCFSKFDRKTHQKKITKKNKINKYLVRGVAI